jgi:lysozyme
MTDYSKIIKTDEGLKLFPYNCSEGFLTIGYGRNIEINGISKEEAEYLLNNDIREAEAKASILVDYFDGLSDDRKIVLVSMAFQMGATGLSKFKQMLTAIDNKDFDKAAAEMLNSKWAKQTPERAKRLSKMMKGS